MPRNFGEIRDMLVSGLGLSVPPVQITYLQEEPAGVAAYAGEVPSGCTFWGAGVSGAFYAKLDAHYNCEIGAFVMGVRPEGELGRKLGETIGWMEGEGYLEKDEAARIPHLEQAPSFVCYGPLGSLPYPPDVVIMFLEPEQAMVALEGAGMGGAHPFAVPLTGRPACSVIPFIMQGKENAALSLGCTGFRTYVDISKGKVLLAIRGSWLHEFSTRMQVASHANSAVLTEDIERKRKFDERE